MQSVHPWIGSRVTPGTALATKTISRVLVKNVTKSWYIICVFRRPYPTDMDLRSGWLSRAELPLAQQLQVRWSAGQWTENWTLDHLVLYFDRKHNFSPCSMSLLKVLGNVHPLHRQHLAKARLQASGSFLYRINVSSVGMSWPQWWYSFSLQVSSVGMLGVRLSWMLEEVFPLCPLTLGVEAGGWGMRWRSWAQTAPAAPPPTATKQKPLFHISTLPSSILKI